MMNCKIIWNDLSLSEWQKRFDRVKRSNLLQSYGYAQAVCKLNKQRARWGLILINEKEAGLVQVLEASILWKLFHGVVLDRGPLWFEGFGGAADIKLFYDEINREFSKRVGRKRRFIPEIEDGPTARALIKQTGLNRLDDQAGYQTLWWDLAEDEETARSKLKANWRGSLNKAERANLVVEWNDKGLFYPALRKIYAEDKQMRGYGGASPKLLDNLAAFSTSENPMIIGKVSIGAKAIAFMMFMKHGRTATYQVGWSSKEGREYNAHHLLLWQARNVLKEYGVKEIDLGGINEESAAGVKKFKEGTNAEISKLIGHYS